MSVRIAITPPFFHCEHYLRIVGDIAAAVNQSGGRK